MKKIGIGLVACNNRGVLDNVIAKLDELTTRNNIVFVFSDDSCDREGVTEYFKKLLDESSIEWIYKEAGMGQVGHAKNVLFQELAKHEVEHIFILEDDIDIKDVGVFDAYIDLAVDTGIKHLMFNANNQGRYTAFVGARLVTFRMHCAGTFVYYHHSVIEKIGLMDTGFINAIEHVEHTYRVYLAGMMGCMWNLPDIPDSDDYLGFQETKSSINHEEGQSENMRISYQHFKEKHGFPFFQTPNLGPQVALDFYRRQAGVN